MNKLQVILVDDERSVLESTAQWLTICGFEVRSFSDSRQALAALDADFFGAVVSDVLMPQLNGLELMQQIHQRFPNVPVILLTGHGDVDMATQAMKLGAYDFMEKPYLPERLSERVRRACDKHLLLQENNKLHNHLASLQGIEATLIGISAPMQHLRKQVMRLAALDTSVVIYGETGTGKELVAQCLHDFSSRQKKNFVPINCSAIPESLIESELFGHEAGAFTGAKSRRIGKFEHADGGTLLLDEIETMPAFVQVKILRALQDGLIERLGSNKQQQVKLRVVAASKEALRDHSSFRQDLYYRLNVSELHLPPLRQRVEDTPLLFDHYLRIAASDNNLTPRALRAGDISALLQYDWPGNVRELKNVAVRFALDNEQNIADMLQHQPASMAGQENHGSVADNSSLEHNQPLAEQVASFESQLLKNALTRHSGSIKQVMLELDLPRRTINQKMIRYGINRADYLDS
ncbi:MAG: sigma-54 dependent transcriptional regulator [Oceanospirillaceae bacterium]